jgi:hypothetical protein
MRKNKKKGKKVILIGSLYEDIPQEEEPKDLLKKENQHVDMGKFLLSISKDLRRDIKFESDKKGFKNASAYICHILSQRKLIFIDTEFQ